MTDSSQSTKQRKRSIVFWVFVIFSVPLIVGVVGYASGYRFNTQSKTLTVTSLISASTIPKGATVTLNGITQTELTPFMETVEPGEYTIRITLAGYQPWEKRLSIAEGKSAVFINELLFANTPHLQEATSIVEPIAGFRALTPNEAVSYAERGFTNTDALRVLTGGPRIVLADIQNDATWLVTETTRAGDATRIGNVSTDAEWNADGLELAYMNDFELWTYELDTQQNTLVRRQSSAFTDMTWSLDGRTLFVTDADSIAAIEEDATGGRQHWDIVPVSGATDLVAGKKQLQFTVNGKTFLDILDN